MTHLLKPKQTPVKHSAQIVEMLSLGSNKPRKQTVHELRCHALFRTVDSDTNDLCRADLVTDYMYEQTLILSGDFRFRFFSAENEYLILFSFRFRP